MANSPVRYYYEKYRQLRALRDAGRMSPQQFFAEVQALRWQDSNQVWWQISAEGVLMYFDGRQWTPAQPPLAPTASVSPVPLAAPGMPPASAPGAPPGMPPGARSGMPAGSSRPIALAPLLPIIPAVLCGGSWFFYTFLGLFKSEGLSGVDWVTPLIVGGLPVVFWLFKKPLDDLLLPLKPVIVAIPWAVRLGIALAVPIFLGWVLSAVIFPLSGYQGVQVSTFISVVMAGVLMRYR